MHGQNVVFSAVWEIELDQEYVDMEDQEMMVVLDQRKKWKNAIQSSAPGQVKVDLSRNLNVWIHLILKQ